MAPEHHDHGDEGYTTNHSSTPDLGRGRGSSARILPARNMASQRNLDFAKREVIDSAHLSGGTAMTRRAAVLLVRVFALLVLSAVVARAQAVSTAQING